ncbi:MAG: hypothetical protein HOK81_08075 [Rhodospirillaceae bacterium]|jgi:hypothetical protein|nr:hypothetical protein [Rhodospirillaceae bacterium]
MATPKDEKPGWFDDWGNVKKLLWVFYAICGLLFLIDFVYHRHALTGWEGFYGFYPVYGFVACVLLVLIAKQMRKVLMRDEDYYERDAAERGDDA